MRKEVIDKIKNVRKELHNNPEHSGCEEITKKIIKDFLHDNTELYVRDYNDGIIAMYESKQANDMIAFRADFDAVSLPDGLAAHICGHDGHTAALLGLALMIDEIKPIRDILLIFQPAEETGEGAQKMMGVLDEYNVSEIYGAHNLPGYEFGNVYTSFDTFACASCGMIFEIIGKPAHAANPGSGISPVKAVCELFKAIDESQHSDRFDEGTFGTLIGCNIGQKAFGTAAEKAEVWVTVRSRTDRDFRRIKEYLERVVKTQCEGEGLSYTLEYKDEFPATVNSADCAKKIIDKCGGKLLDEPMRWSEDFGHFLIHNEKVSGAFFGVGAGNCPDLHTMDYEYPDELFKHQIDAFIKLI